MLMWILYAIESNILVRNPLNLYGTAYLFNYGKYIRVEEWMNLQLLSYLNNNPLHSQSLWLCPRYWLTLPSFTQPVILSVGNRWYVFVYGHVFFILIVLCRVVPQTFEFWIQPEQQKRRRRKGRILRTLLRLLVSWPFLPLNHTWCRMGIISGAETSFFPYINHGRYAFAGRYSSTGWTTQGCIWSW